MNDKYTKKIDCVCMTLTEGNSATLELVGTLEAFRRKGLGTSVITAALQELREVGVKTVSLRAEPDGIKLYQNLGFKDYCKRIVARYNWPRSEE